MLTFFLLFSVYVLNLFLEMLATSFIGKINNRVDYVLVSTLPLTGLGTEDQDLINKKLARTVFLRNLRTV